MLQNNSGNTSQVYSRIASSNIVSFSDVQYGTYTLVINHNNYDTHINGNINIRQKEVSHNVILVPEGADYKSFTILNDVGRDIVSLYVRQHFRHPWGDNILTNNLPNGNQHTIILMETPTHVSIKIVDVIGNSYTQPNVPFTANGFLAFTINDQDTNNINHLFDFFDSHNFDIFLFCNSDHVSINSFSFMEILYLKINDFNIELEQNNHWTEFPFQMGAFFDFNHGQTYHIELKTINPENVYSTNLTIVQDMIVNYPETIGTNEISINWRHVPNDNLHLNFQAFWIFANNWSESPFSHIETIPHVYRTYTIPSGFIPSPTLGYVSFEFCGVNFSNSDRMIAVSSFFSESVYYNGALRKIQFDNNISTVLQNYMGKIQE